MFSKTLLNRFILDIVSNTITENPEVYNPYTWCNKHTTALSATTDICMSKAKLALNVLKTAFGSIRVSIIH